MRRHWWLITVVLPICFTTSPGWSFHIAPTGNEEAICSRAEVLMCDNFENRNAGGEDWAKHTYKNNGWSLSERTCQTVSTTTSHDGTKSLQHFLAQVIAGTNNATACRGVDNGGAGFMSSSFPGHRTIYMRWYTKFSSNWVRSRIAEKFSIVQPISTNGRTHVGTTVGGNTAPSVGLEAGGVQKFQNVNGTQAFVLNTWQCLETRLTANSSATATDGYLQGWIDGVQHWEYPNLAIWTSGVSTSPVFDYIEFSGYWNCFNSDTGCYTTATNNHPAMYRWIDRVVVSTQRIGCVGTPTTPPAAPSSLNIR